MHYTSNESNWNRLEHVDRRFESCTLNKSLTPVSGIWTILLLETDSTWYSVVDSFCRTWEYLPNIFETVERFTDAIYRSIKKKNRTFLSLSPVLSHSIVSYLFSFLTHRLSFHGKTYVYLASVDQRFNRSFPRRIFDLGYEATVLRSYTTTLTGYCRKSSSFLPVRFDRSTLL